MRRTALAALALVLLTACKVETTVGIEADADGAGRVEVEVALDREAAERVPDLGRQLRVDDLRAAGWEVGRPRRSEGGGLAMEAVKRYRTPAEAAQAVEDLSGPDGPFRGFRVSRERSFLRTKTALRGTVDLRAGLEGFGDDALRERLGGTALGVDPAELERRLGQSLSRVFTFRVEARLPGEVSSNAPTTGDEAVWRPTLGERVVLEATAERWNVRNIAAAAVSAGAAGALVVLLLRRRRSDPSG